MVKNRLQQLQGFGSACLLLFIQPTAQAVEAVKTKDGIQLNAKLETDKNGKKRISCILINNSKHILASYNKVVSSSEFQITLLDRDGVTITQESKWAEEYVQKDSKRFQDTRGPGVEECIEPGAKVEFEFDLVDAYGVRASMGRTLNISWDSLWLQETAETTEKRNTNGKIIPRYVEKYFFPSRWSISVSLPLPEKTEETKTQAPSNPETTAPNQLSILPGVDVGKSHIMAEKKNTASLASAIGWWWALLAVPFVFVIWLTLRLWKR